MLQSTRVLQPNRAPQAIRVRNQTRKKPFAPYKSWPNKSPRYIFTSKFNKLISFLQDWAGSVFRAAECRPPGPKRRGVPWWGTGPSWRVELILRREIPWPAGSGIWTERFIYILARIWDFYNSKNKLIRYILRLSYVAKYITMRFVFIGCVSRKRIELLFI